LCLDSTGIGRINGSHTFWINEDIFTMATIKVHKRNSTFVDITNLVEELSNIGLGDTLKKYYEKPFEHETMSIVAGPSFMQYLNKLF
jgi:hypothetical protein